MSISRAPRSSHKRPSRRGGNDEVHAADPPGHHAAPRPRGVGRRSPRRSSRRSTPPTRRSTRRPGVTPAQGLAPPETATTVRVQDGKTLTTDGPFVELKEAVGGYLLFEADDLDAAIELAAQIPAAQPGRRDRGAPDHGVVATARADLPRPVGPRPRRPDRLPRRLRPRRGGRAGGLRDRGRALAARRRARNPGAWLITTARNRAIDRIRRDRTLAEKTKLLEVPRGGGGHDGRDDDFPDERLELIFTCCHPALATDAQVALTLRTLGGLTTAEIARAFLVAGADDGAAARAGQEEDQGGRDPVPRPARPPAARPARRRARGRLPDLQRGLRRPRRPGRARRCGSAARWPS